MREAGGVAIADEVQVGFGRVGSTFWAFDAEGAVPDIVTMGKPFGNGHPLGAVATTREVRDAFQTGMEYFNTFGGNPVSCAAGLAVLDVLEDERLRENATAMGELLLEGLRSLQDRLPILGDVRGRGLFLGFEMVKSRETLEPAAREARALVNRMKEEGVLLSTDGPLHNVIKIKPPLVFSAADADLFPDPSGARPFGRPLSDMSEPLLPAVEIDPDGPPTASVIWLHGLGADGHDFEPIVPELRLPDEARVRFVFPHAPMRPVTINGGAVMRAWYDIKTLDLERSVDEADLESSAAACSRHGFGTNERRASRPKGSLSRAFLKAAPSPFMGVFRSKRGSAASSRSPAITRFPGG